MNTFGKNFRLTTFGESHGIGLGAVIDGCPAGIEICLEDIQKELDKRKPGQSAITTERKEGDIAEILSGIFEGKTTGAPIGVLVRNADQRSKDYDNIKNLYRPGHADKVWDEKFGFRDYRGGGRSSGRETISRVIGGAIAKKILQKYDCEVFAYVSSVGDIDIQNFDKNLLGKFPTNCPDEIISKKMEEFILKSKENGDSVGGKIRIHIINAPKSLGEPVFDKFQAMIAHSLFSIATIRSLEFGIGNEITKMKGSESNKIDFGISGGITNGNEISIEIGIKPASSISISQDMEKRGGGMEKNVSISGRHDPCIAPRAVIVAESMVNLVIVDLILEKRMNII